MKLLTKEIEKSLPNFRTDGSSSHKAMVKFFTPWGGWTWYGTEYNPAERCFYGLVDNGSDKEWGYWTLDEMEAVRGPWGLKIERDMYWTPQEVEA
jgi:hypothetical protein